LSSSAKRWFVRIKLFSALIGDISPIYRRSSLGRSRRLIIMAGVWELRMLSCVQFVDRFVTIGEGRSIDINSLT
jgi:hypothetical protein